MKRLIACLALTFSLFHATNSNATTDWEEWETTYAQLITQSERRALLMLEERYQAAAEGPHKLYLSSRIFEFMMLRNQPYHGSRSTLKDPYSRIEQQFIRALNAEMTQDFDIAKQIYTKLLNQMKKAGNLDGKILLGYQLCRMLNAQGHYSQASSYCHSLSTHIQDSTTSVLPVYQALRVIANNFEFLGNYQSALDTYQQYLANIPAYVDPSGVYNDAGLLLKTLGNIPLAKEYLTISIILREKAQLPLELAQSHHSMGEILLAAKEHSQAIEHFSKSKAILKQFQHSYGLSYVLLGLGKTHIALEDFETGTTMLREALKTSIEQKNIYVQGESYLALASANIQQQKYTPAQSFADNAFNVANEISSARLAAQALQTLANIAELQGDYAAANSYYRSYFSSQSNVQNERHQVAYLALESARNELLQQAELNQALADKKGLIDQVSRGKDLQHVYQLFIVILLAFIAFFFIQRRKEIRIAEVDLLTGALNRAASIREIKQQGKIQRQEYKYVVILMDLDDFKKINDNYGHPTGDRALAHVAKTINKHIQPTDLFGRLGGEEFVVLIKNIDELDIVEHVSRLHSAIGNTSFRAENNEKLYVTASFSYLATSNSLADFDELYSILDQALYQAKQNGKNRIIDAFNEPIYLPTSAYSAVNS